MNNYCQFLSFNYDNDEVSQISTQKSKIRPLVINSGLETNGRFRKNAIRKNFTVKLDKQMRKFSFLLAMLLYLPTQRGKGNCIHFLHLCLSNIFQHQVQDLYTSRKLQVCSYLSRLKTRFHHQQIHQQANEIKGSFTFFQKTATAVNGVENQKTETIEKNLKTQ